MSRNSILILIQKYEEARQQNKSIYLDADEFDELADYYDRIEDLDEAREVIRIGLQIHPNTTSLTVKKAKFSVYDSNYTEALHILSACTEYDCDLYLVRIECFLHLGLHAEAHEITKAILEEETDELDEVFAELGFAYLDAELYSEAILYFKKSLDFDTENKEVLVDLAYANELIGDHDEAIRVNNLLLDIDPYNYDAWVNIGKLYTLKEDYVNAIEAFDFAITVDGEDFNIYKVKGHCESLMGNTADAIKTFNKVLELAPNESSTLFLLAECYQQIEDYTKALEYMELYAEENGQTIEYMAKKVQLLLLQGEYDYALHLTEEAIKETPDSLELHIIASEIKLRQDLFDEAEAYLVPMMADNTDDFFLVNMRSIIAIKKEEYDKAIFLSEKLLVLDPSNMEVKQRLALLYFEVGDKKEFDALLNEFTDKELLSLFHYIYTPNFDADFSREQLLFYLDDARRRRVLFKNMQY